MYFYLSLWEKLVVLTLQTKDLRYGMRRRFTSALEARFCSCKRKFYIYFETTYALQPVEWLQVSLVTQIFINSKNCNEYLLQNRKDGVMLNLLMNVTIMLFLLLLGVVFINSFGGGLLSNFKFKLNFSILTLGGAFRSNWRQRSTSNRIWALIQACKFLKV